MGIITTNKTQLLDRTVCVQRRLVRNDGMGGTYQDWQTLVQRYWVRIYPEHHQERGIHELGEHAVDSTHRALGQPVINGHSLMTGDRFYDLKNNETYDILGLIRPRGRHPQSAMHQFVLRVVKDDGVVYGQCGVTEGSALVATTGGGTTGGGTGGGALEGFILRHFEGADMAAIRMGTFNYGDYQGFTFGHSDIELSTVDMLRAQGKRFFRYFALLDFPFAAAGDDEAWKSFLRTTVQIGWGARFVTGLTAGQFVHFCLPNTSPCGGLQEYRELIDWSQIDSGRRTAILDSMLPLTADGVMFDQVWLEPPDFFWCGDAAAPAGACGSCRSCVSLVVYSGGNRADYASRFPAAIASQKAFVEQAQVRLAAQGGYAFSNGRPNITVETVGANSDKVPRPIYLENSASGGAIKPEALARWREDQRNVLSIDIPAAPVNLAIITEFQQLKQLFAAEGRWVAAKGPDNQDSNMVQANAELAAVRPTG
jgi:hypothetical protein